MARPTLRPGSPGIYAGSKVCGSCSTAVVSVPPDFSVAGPLVGLADAAGVEGAAGVQLASASPPAIRSEFRRNDLRSVTVRPPSRCEITVGSPSSARLGASRGGQRCAVVSTCIPSREKRPKIGEDSTPAGVGTRPERIVRLTRGLPFQADPDSSARGRTAT